MEKVLEVAKGRMWMGWQYHRACNAATAVAQPRTTPVTPPAAVKLQPASEPNLDGLDAFITSVMQEWKVPCLAIAVVKDGQVILSKGYGYRNVEPQLPVTPRTLFAIGSITKSFTVSVLSMLADEGKLDWDTPVRTYLPDFQLHDPVATEHMTPRDLVTHRSGLPSHDALSYHSSLTRKQMYDRLRYLEPSKAFRSTFQYNNLMFMTAGILAGHIAGMSWEDLVRQRLFQPLGFVEPFIGQYELGSTTVTIALRGNDALTFTALGELTYELAPHGTTFDIKGRNGFSVEFKQDAAGAVTDMVVYQPNSTVVAERQ